MALLAGIRHCWGLSLGVRTDYLPWNEERLSQGSDRQANEPQHISLPPFHPFLRTYYLSRPESFQVLILLFHNDRDHLVYYVNADSEQILRLINIVDFVWMLGWIPEIFSNVIQMIV